MKPTIIIPARRGSTRFPSKPLALINNKPLIYWTWRQASKSGFDVVVATDCPEIKLVIEGFGGRALLTPIECRNGTERAAIAARELNLDLVVNWQGDAPMIPSVWPRFLAIKMLETQSDVATAAFWGRAEQGSVEAIGSGDFAQDFKRESGRDELILHHVGIYAYTSAALNWYIRQDPSERETAEGLEQLRWQSPIALSIFQQPAHEMRECNYPSDIAPLESALGAGNENIWAVA